MFIELDPVIFAFFPLTAAVIYLPVYAYTRKAEHLKTELKEKLLNKLILCFLFNLIAVLISKHITIDTPGKNFLFLLLIIADTDLMIRKIPTEFLVCLFAVAVWRFAADGKWLMGVLCILCFSFWWAVLKKKIIGLYDVLMILALTIFQNDVRSVLIFYSLFLVCWGSLGAVLRFLLKRNPQTKIPLAPLMILAFLLTQLIP